MSPNKRGNAGEFFYLLNFFILSSAFFQLVVLISEFPLFSRKKHSHAPHSPERQAPRSSCFTACPARCPAQERQPLRGGHRQTGQRRGGESPPSPPPVREGISRLASHTHLPQNSLTQKKRGEGVAKFSVLPSPQPDGHFSSKIPRPYDAFHGWP